MICGSPLRNGASSQLAVFGDFGRAAHAGNEFFGFEFHTHKFRTLDGTSSSTLDGEPSRMLDMSTASERVKLMMDALGKDQVEFGELAGTSRSVVNQWLSGKIKTIGAEYAYALQKKTGYSAEWIQLGTGPEKLLRVVPDNFSDVVRSIATDLMHLPKEKLLELKTWSATEAEIRRAQADQAEAAREQDQKTS